VQIGLRKQIDVINARVPPGSIFYWSSSYYDTATHGLAEHVGIKTDLDIRYVLAPSQIQIPRGPVFLTVLGLYKAHARLQEVPDWATVQNLGFGLFRLDPISVDIESGDDGFLAEGDPIRLQARLAVGDQLKAKVGVLDYLDEGKKIGSSAQQPFELYWKGPPPGRHEIVARASYGAQDALTSRPVVIYVGVAAVELTVKSISSLALESRDHSVDSELEIMEIGGDESITGLYFDSVKLRQGVQIAKAYLQFTVAGSDSRRTELDIQAELSRSAPPPRIEQANLSRRPRTVSNVKWSPKPWVTVGTHEQSPNLARIIQEVVSQTAWQPGNSLMLLIRGTGRRAAALPNGEGSGGPRLYVELQSK